MIPGRLGTIGAVFSTASCFNRKEGANLYFSCIVKLAVNGGGSEDEFKESNVIDVGYFFPGPVMTYHGDWFVGTRAPAANLGIQLIS